MEFKGTKGKWFIDKKREQINKFGSKVNVISSTRANEICHVYNIDHNALLISKAPEMLEMIDALCEELEFHQVSLKIAKDGRKLIKEATELKSE
jgi:hypothetical protein